MAPSTPSAEIGSREAAPGGNGPTEPTPINEAESETPTRRRRLGLRARVTLSYALGALLLSSMVALGTFTLARARLVSEVEEAAESQAFRNAIDLRQRLQFVPELRLDPSADSGSAVATTVPGGLGPVVDVDDVLEAITGGEDGGVPEGEPGEDAAADPVDLITPILDSLFGTNGAESLLVINRRDRSLAGLRQDDIPDGIRDVVMAGQPAKQRYIRDGQPRLVVGVPINGQQAQYYEVVSLGDLQSTLNSLQAILAGTALAGSLAGAALGSYSARRALQPLAEVSAAAESIALGRFETRLDGHADPDLAGLTSSFNHMVDALQSRIERDGRFASDVSHELRSPLMTLAASVGVLEGRRSDLPPSAQQAVDLLKQDVDRFERLVEDLLEISRMDVGAIELDLSPVFLAEFLRFVVADSRSPEVPVEHLPADENLIIAADKRRLAQALTNLLDNATKYGNGATSVSYRQVDGRVQIFVEDLGPGVRVEDRERIFDRFTRAAGNAGRRGATGGVGLGLSLVAEHIRLHHGTVSVTDRLDGRSGARFVVDLPLGEQLELDEEMAT